MPEAPTTRPGPIGIAWTVEVTQGRQARRTNVQNRNRDAQSIRSQTTSAVKPNAVPKHLTILARAGYASRGIVYMIVGALTTAAAIGSKGCRTTGAKGALIELAWQPFGYALVAAFALGLCSFAAWCVFQAINDTDGYGRTLKGIVIRIGILLTGSTYLGLAGYAISLAFAGTDGESTSDDPAARDWTAWLMAQPFGPWLVVGIGLALSVRQPPASMRHGVPISKRKQP